MSRILLLLVILAVASGCKSNFGTNEQLYSAVRGGSDFGAVYALDNGVDKETLQAIANKLYAIAANEATYEDTADELRKLVQALRKDPESYAELANAIEDHVIRPLLREAEKQVQKQLTGHARWIIANVGIGIERGVELYKRIPDEVPNE
jgi:hypothetical protein